MEVICELMRLRPDRVQDYRDMHDNTWPELVTAIRDSGFLEEYVYMLDNLVIVIMKCEDFKDSVRPLAATEVYQRWTMEVRGMLAEDRELFRTGEKIVDLSPIWDLSRLCSYGASMSIPKDELDARCRAALLLAEKKAADLLFVYYDEYNVMNGRYLTGWCPTIERGAVIVSRFGEPFLIGGPEAGPTARLDSGIKEIVSSQVFMVPEEEYPGAEMLTFRQIADRYFAGARIQRIGLVGGNTIPHSIYTQLAAGISDAEIVDLTDQFETLRYVKSPWEHEMVQRAYEIAERSFQRLAQNIHHGKREYEAAAEAEYAARRAGADGFGYRTIIGSGERAIGIVPPATERVFQSGEMVLTGVAPRYNGYNATACAPVVVGNKPGRGQEGVIKDVYRALLLTRDAIRPGLTGREIDRVPREFLRKQGYRDYIPMPFVHSSGLSEFEKPFFGPNSDDVIQENQVLCIDIAMFGHPEVPGIRAETGYWVTGQGVESFSPYMEQLFERQH